MILQETINTLVQLAIAMGVAGGAWALIGKRIAPFRDWTGLTAPTPGWWKGTLILFAGITVISSLAVHFGPFGAIATSEGTVGGRLAEAGMSATTIVLILIMAVIKTGLTEEIIFRGLIAKRLINRLGFKLGNLLQAAIFGAVHLLLFAAPGGPEATAASVAIVFGLPGLAGWIMGYANEKFGGGSIVPGWAIHAGGNLISYLTFAAG
ncbi:CPBP family intramembrane glutamic endopeptidase [Paraurantiacibacter namhicola]|uniref:CAAX amino terminal protease self-immunity n=1 Tax=Paraurantiacibacter namhicola TaxID=645517 RepID=A0A1C7D4W2_9SPHN|nr:CPBP family intramembrane glutamic endopeptidase [Paraurantiacibacter namhicola]ANU06516.1 CAAX amino terminal protease self- immunity [Paraurantiacibacter namhicola]